MTSRPLTRRTLPLIFLLGAGLACNAVTGIFVEPKSSISEIPATMESPVGNDLQPEPFAHSTFCPAVTESILEAATQFEEDTSNEDSAELEEQYLVTYHISGDQISEPSYEDVSADLIDFQKDVTGHQAIWDDIVALIPARERHTLAEFSIVTDGEGNLLAAVTQTGYDPALWALEVDIRDSSDRLNLAYTLIHEYAHLLTLGPNQVTPSEAVFNYPGDNGIYLSEVGACPNYFPGEGCSQSDSYINAFFNEFWSGIHPEWQDINLIEDDDFYYEALDDFFYAHEDQFVTSYAASNPEEDIAEVFTFFVLASRPNGDNIAEQKILFFYRYPELVQLRDEILRGVCQLDP